jgi:hypothetical protein
MMKFYKEYYMRGKRFLTMFTATFTLFVLAGCGYGTISSVNEEDYFPHFEVKADKIYHSITKLCIGFKNCDKDEEAFKSKGAYEITHYSPDTFVRYDPLGDGVIEKAELISDYSSSSHGLNDNDEKLLSLDILGDNIKRDNELFEKVFGHDGGTFLELHVEKHFPMSDISYFEAYGELLERQGFEKMRNWWGKSQSNIMSNVYGWCYVVNEDSSITATWRVNTTVSAFMNWDLVGVPDFWPYSMECTKP